MIKQPYNTLSIPNSHIPHTKVVRSCLLKTLHNFADVGMVASFAKRQCQNLSICREEENPMKLGLYNVYFIAHVFAVLLQKRHGVCAQFSYAQVPA